jgi:hypothetical protein
MERYNRKIDLNLSDAFFDAVKDVPQSAIWEAVGRLTYWAAFNPRYTNVLICGSNEGSIVATYREVPGGDVTYSMLLELQPAGKSFSGPHS